MKLNWIIFFILTGCTATGNSDKNDVRVVVQGIIDADNAADIASVLSSYSSDAVLMPPGKSEITGTTAIRKNYEAIFANSVLELSVKEEELVVSGNYAICKGRTMGQIRAKADSSVRDVNDKFIMILEKRDSQWKISKLIWN